MTPSLLRYRPFDIGGQSLECDQPVQRMKVLNQLSHAVSAQSFVEAPETTPSKAAGLPEEVVENLLRVGQRFKRLYAGQIQRLFAIRITGGALSAQPRR